MAQTGYTPISIYYSSTASNVPTAGNLVAGELAINTADGKLFYKDSSGVVQTLATKGGNVSSFSGGTTGLTPNTATTGVVTLAGTLAVANGGTGGTTSTGSGAVVLATSPTITNPSLGGSTSGSVTLAVPAVAGSNTATLPAATGTVMVSGNMPAFRGAASTNYTILNVTNTQIAFNTKQFDTASAYSSGVFTVPVTGYYQVNATIAWSGDITGQWSFNWSITSGNPVYTNAVQINTATGSGTNHSLSASDLLYLTAGQSLTGWVYQSTGATKYVTAGGETFASIVLVRAA